MICPVDADLVHLAGAMFARLLPSSHTPSFGGESLSTAHIQVEKGKAMTEISIIFQGLGNFNFIAICFSSKDLLLKWTFINIFDMSSVAGGRNIGVFITMFLSSWKIFLWSKANTVINSSAQITAGKYLASPHVPAADDDIANGS